MDSSSSSSQGGTLLVDKNDVGFKRFRNWMARARAIEETIKCSRDSDAYVVPKATTFEDSGRSTVQSSTVIAASRDSAGDRDDSSGMEIDVQEDETMNGNTSTSLSSKIDSLIREEEKRLPSWVMGKYKAYFNPYITSTGDLQQNLRHVAMPSALAHFKDTLHTLNYDSMQMNEMDTSIKSKNSMPIHIGPLVAVDTAILDEFLKDCSSGSADSFVNICDLADNHLRVSRAEANDVDKINKCISREEKRKEKGEALIKQKQDIIDRVQLECAEGGVLVTGCDRLLKEVHRRKEVLKETEAAEEEARRIYEEAKAKRQQASEQLDTVNCTYDMVTFQKEMVVKTNKLRIELENFNATVASKRIDVYKSAHKFFDHTKHELVDKRLTKSLPKVVTDLLDTFALSTSECLERATSEDVKKRANSVEDKAHDSVGPLGNQSFLIMIRSGLEFVRLWRQLCPNVQKYPMLCEKLFEFENESRQIASKLPDPITLFDSKSPFRKENSTVVLYFDHIFHGTPEGHVESQARVSTCLKQLKMQMDNSRGNRKDRTLIIHSCNDVTSPPLWVLPLVHSPYYLGQLYEFAEEARRDDLFVPLEFDTEWESENDDSDDESSDEFSNSEMQRRRLERMAELNLRTKLEIDFKIPEELRDYVGEDVDKFEGLLSADKDDVDFSMRYLKTEESKRMRAKLEEISRASLTPGMTVSTPYGNATVKDRVREDEIIQVEFDFGAKGYFNVYCVKKIAAKPIRSSESQLLQGRSAMFVSPHIRTPLKPGPKPGFKRGAPKNHVELTDPFGKYIVSSLMAKYRTQAAAADAIAMNRSSMSVWLRGTAGPSIGVAIGTRAKVWANQFTSDDLNKVLDLNYPLSTTWLRETNLNEHGNSRHLNKISVPPPDEELLAFMKEEAEERSASSQLPLQSQVQTSNEDSEQKTKYRPPPRNTTTDPETGAIMKSRSRGAGGIKVSAFRQLHESTEIGNLLRRHLKIAMNTKRVAQLGLAQMLTRMIGVEVTQKMVSNWFLYRMYDPHDTILSTILVKWTLDQKVRGTPVELFQKWHVKLEEMLIKLGIDSSSFSMADARSNQDSEHDGSGGASEDTMIEDDDLSDDESQLKGTDLDAQSGGADLDIPLIVAKKEVVYDSDEYDASQKKQRSRGDRGTQKEVMEPFDDNLAVNGHSGSVESMHDFTKAVKLEEDEKIATTGFGGDKVVNNVSDQVKIEMHTEKKTHISKAGAKGRSTSPRKSGKDDTVEPKFKHNLFAFRPENNSEDDVKSDEINPVHEDYCARKMSIKNDYAEGNGVNDGERSGNDDVDYENKDEEEGEEEEEGEKKRLTESQKALLPLREEIVKEMRRRGVNQSAVYKQASMQIKGIPYACISRFLNQLLTDSAGKLVNALSQWLQKSKKLDPHLVLVEEDVEYCPLCGRASTAFSSRQGYLRHIGWCRNKLAEKQRVDEFKKNSQVIASNNNADRNKEGTADTYSSGRKRRIVTETSEEKRAKTSPGFLSSRAMRQVETFPWSPGGHTDECDECKKVIAPKEIVKCKFCPLSFHLSCCKPVTLTKQPDESIGESFCCHYCASVGCMTAKLTSGKVISKEHVSTWILLFKHRWRFAIILDAPNEDGEILLKWWRADGRGGNVIRGNVLENEIMIPDEETQAMMDSRTSHWNLSKFMDTNRFNDSKHISTHSEARMRLEGVKDMPPKPRRGRPPLKKKPEIENSQDEDHRILVEDSDPEEEFSLQDRNRDDHEETTMSDTYIGMNSVKAALCAAGIACRAVDISVASTNTNVFVCTRPPGHHAGRHGCTKGCLSTGFCLLNNAAIALTYARVRWGLERIAVVDIDVHMGNGTAELLKNDPRAFMATTQMIYGVENKGFEDKDDSSEDAHSSGFYPLNYGQTEITDNFVSVGVFPESWQEARSKSKEGRDMDVDDSNTASTVHSLKANLDDSGKNSDGLRIIPPLEEIRKFQGSQGFRRAIGDVIIPMMEKFDPQMLIISAGFDGFSSDPIGGELNLSTDDYSWATKKLLASMSRKDGSGHGRVISLLEGGYDTKLSLGLAKCVDTHVRALRFQDVESVSQHLPNPTNTVNRGTDEVDDVDDGSDEDLDGLVDEVIDKMDEEKTREKMPRSDEDEIEDTEDEIEDIEDESDGSDVKN